MTSRQPAPPTSTRARALGRRRRIAIATSVGLLALTAAACSSDTRGATATTSAATAPPATAKTTQQNGQIAFELRNKAPYESVVSIMNPDGTGVVTLASPAPFEAPQWSPDGKSIAGMAAASGTIAGHVVNVDTGAVVDIPNSGGVFMDCFVWRPDAQRLACDSLNSADQNSGIYTIRASDWSDLRKVTASPVLDDRPGSYSPDGKRIVFARFNHDGSSVGLFVINADGTGLKQITPTGALLGGNKWGDWSPQGNEIVFAQGVNAGARAAIWVVHADGSGLHEIHFDSPIPCGGPKADPKSRGCFDATWSPDGKQIAFIVNEPSGEGRSVYTANIDGSNLTQLTHGNSGNPDWGTRPPT